MKPVKAHRYDGTGRRLETAEVTARTSPVRDGRVDLFITGVSGVLKHYDMSTDDWDRLTANVAISSPIMDGRVDIFIASEDASMKHYEMSLGKWRELME